MLEAVTKSVKELYDGRAKILPVDVTFGRYLLLRHFMAKLPFRN